MNTIVELAAIMGKRLDPDQKRAVETDGNLVVSAGAGSGKTTVLSYRYLRLLLDGVHADEILALTFTEKATLEMQARIGSLIQRFSRDEALDEDTRALFMDEWEHHFPKASISTLDGFSSRILRSEPYLYGLTSDYTPEGDDGGENERNAVMLARKMLSAVKEDRGADVFARLYKPQEAVDLLTILAKKEFHLPHRLPEDLADHVKAAIAEKREEERENILSSLSRIVKTGESDALAPSSKKAVVQAKRCLEAFDAASDDATWMCVLEAPEASWSKPRGKGEGDLLIKEMSDEFSSAGDGFRRCCNALEKQDDVASMIDFLRRYEDAFQATKRQTGILTFGDVSALAIDLLKNQPDLRRSYVHRFKSIMIDEFQDDNEAQKDLLYLLSAKDSFDKKGIPSPDDLLPDRLFFVGDEKQSIYQFRGADVSVFKNLAAELGGGAAIELTTNYRTEPKLISLFSTLFRFVMQNEGKSCEATFTELKERKASPGVEGSFTLMVKPKGGEHDDEDAENADCEAFSVAKKIREMLDTDNYLIADGQGGVRRPRFCDIALLLRNTSHQMSFERAFKAQDIPYTIGKVSRSLMLESPANDIYAFLQTLVYPEDRLAFLSVLRSPFCALSDEKVFSIINEHKTAFDPEASPQCADYQECCARYQAAKAYARASTLPALVQYLWYNLGYRFFYLERPGYHAYLDHYDYLYRLAELAQNNGESLVTFLDDLRPFLGSADAMNSESGEVIAEARDSIRIMTVHAAKGLEFPVVFVSNFDAGSLRGSGPYFFLDSQPVPYYDDRPGGGYAGVGKLFFDAEEAKTEMVAETKRLLYVAVTRAEYHLVFSGFHGRSSAGNALDWMEAAFDVSYDEDEEIYRCGCPDVNVETIKTIPQQALFVDRDQSAVPENSVLSFYGTEKPSYSMPLRRIKATAFAPEGTHTPQAVALPSLKSDAVLKEAVAMDPDAVADWGTFVHRLVESFMAGKTEDPVLLLPEGLQKLDAGRKSVLVDDGQTLCKAFLSSEYYRKEVAPFHPETEVRFSSHETFEGSPVVVEGAVDVLVHKPDHIEVLDFKTDQLDDPSVHRGQLSLYRKATERMYRMPVRTAIIYLRNPTAVRWLDKEERDDAKTFD